MVLVVVQDGWHKEMTILLAKVVNQEQVTGLVELLRMVPLCMVVLVVEGDQVVMEMLEVVQVDTLVVVLVSLGNQYIVVVMLGVEVLEEGLLSMLVLQMLIWLQEHIQLIMQMLKMVQFR